MEYQFRTIETWPGKRTLRPERSRFKSGYRATLYELDTELRQLQARNIVIQAYVSGNDIRLDGMLRASASPRSPGIILSFGSKHGALSYPCDTYDFWHDNLRAITLALKALRTVDRYGVTKRAEQYQGWAKLPAPDSRGITSPHQAANFLATLLQQTWEPIISHRKFASNAIRAAEMKTHPDRGGNVDDFKKIQQCRELLTSHHGRL